MRAFVGGRLGFNPALEGTMVYVGLDVSLNSVSICVVDEAGAILREGSVCADAPSIFSFVESWRHCIVRVGLEAGPMSEWLTASLARLGLPAISLEARQVKAALSAMTVKTDRNDARGIAQIVRTGWYKTVHVKSIGSQHARTLAAGRKHLVRSIAAAEQVIRGLLRPFGLRVGVVSKKQFAARIGELTEGNVALASVMEALLAARDALMREYGRLHKLVLRTVRDDPVCRLLMTMPGIGPVSALTFRSTIDDPTRFSHSRSVGAYLGLTPRRYQSGEVDRMGRITKVGDGEARTALFEAANVVLRPSTRWSPIKAWAVRVAQRQGTKRAKVALARKMAVVLHRMWRDGTEFRWTAAAA
jgi:transposase